MATELSRMAGRKLKYLWEAFIKLPNKKALALDTFLVNFWKECHRPEMPTTGGPLNFSDTRGMCNLLSREFLSDIHRVCSQAEEDDTADLENYLLKERGWLLLFAMHKLGVQGLLCCKELTTLLVSLLPVCQRLTCTKIHSDLSDIMPLSDSFSGLTSPKSQAGLNTNKRRPILTRILNKHHRHQRKDNPLRKRISNPNTISKRDNDAGSSDSAEERKTASKKSAKTLRQVRLRERKPRKRIYSWSQYVHEQHLLEIDQDLDNFLQHCQTEKPYCDSVEFCILICAVLKDLCVGDLKPLSPSKMVSSSIMPQLVQNLHHLVGLKMNEEVDCFVSNICPWSDENKLYFSLFVIRLILTAGAMTLVQQNGINILTAQRTLLCLLEVAQHISKKYKCSRLNSEGDMPTMSNLVIQLLSDALLGQFKLIDTVFQYLPFNLTFISNAVSMMRDTLCNTSLHLLQLIIQHKDAESSISHSDKATNFDLPLTFNCEAVQVISNLIATLKTTKVNYIHTMTCLKQKHRKCHFGQYMDHHHDILGLAESAIEQSAPTQSPKSTPDRSSSPLNTSPFKVASANKCIIAILANFLLQTLPLLKSKSLQTEILSTLYYSGICCCMDPVTIAQAAVDTVQSVTVSIRNSVLDIVNRLLLEQLFGANYLTRSEVEICLLCCDRDHRKNINHGLREHSRHSVTPTIDSGFSSTDNEKAVCFNAAPSSVKLPGIQSKWKGLSVFKKLIFNNETSLASMCLKSLCTLAVKGNSVLRQCLFTELYMLIFQVYGQELTSTAEQSEDSTAGTDGLLSQRVVIPSHVMFHCLCAFPYLLQEEYNLIYFLQRKGFEKLCSLLVDAYLREALLNILESVIVLEECRQKTLLQCSKKVQVIISSRQESSENMLCRTYLKLLDSISKNDPQESTICVSSDNKHLQVDSTSESGLESVLSSVQNSTVTGGSVMCYSDIEHITFMTDLWNTTHTLCTRSKTFFACFINSPCAVSAYEWLTDVLASLTESSNKESVPVEGQTEDIDSDITSLPKLTLDTSNSLALFKMRLLLTEALMGVCFCMPSKISISKLQGNSKEQLLSQVENRLLKCAVWPYSYLRLVFDMLLSCAGLVTSHKLIKLPHQSVDEEAIAEDFQPCALSSTDEDSETMHSEFGYETDIESTQSDLSTTLLSSQGKFSSDKSSHLIHSGHDPVPPVYHILIGLLVTFQTEDAGRKLLPYVLQRIIHGGKENRKHIHAICAEGILEKLLSGFEKQLISDSKHDEDVQQLLFELIQLLGGYQMNAREFQLFLRLFHKTNPPSPLLLNSLISIVEKCSTGPRCYLEFPTVKTFGHETFDGTANLANYCPWDVGALRQQIPEQQLPWHTYQISFTLSVWVAIESSNHRCRSHTFTESDHGPFSDYAYRRGKVDLLSAMGYECCHLLSIGNSDKLLEVWINTSCGTIVLRLTRMHDGGMTVLKECDWSCALSSKLWHHMVLMYSESLDGSTLIGKINLILNGCDSREFILDHPACGLVSKPPSLIVGHGVIEDDQESITGVLKLGNMMLFKGASFTSDICFHLYALGPNCTSLSHCDCSQLKRKYSPFLTKKLTLYSDVSKDVLVGTKTVSLTEAQETLLLSYSPGSPDKFCCYAEVGEIDGIGTAAGATSMVQKSAFEIRLLEQVPSVNRAVVRARIVPRMHQCLEEAVHQSGCIGTFLVLVAKVYESCHIDSATFESDMVAMEMLQSRSLEILFAVISHMPRLATAFEDRSGYWMLAKILTSSHSIVGIHTLKALLDAATSESLLRYDKTKECYTLRQNTEAIVKNAAVVEHLLLAWRVWFKADNSVTEMLFLGLEMLVRESHPHQDFNIRQFQAVAVVDKLCSIYQERIQDNIACLSSRISHSVVNIIQNLLGSPPDFHTFIILCDFLLMIHPAASTFIHHNRDIFYYTLWKETSTQTTTRFLGSLKRNLQSSTTESTSSKEELQSEDDSSNTNAKGVILRQSASLPTLKTLFPRRQSTSQDSSTSAAGAAISDEDEDDCEGVMLETFPALSIATDEQDDMTEEIKIEDTEEIDYQASNETIQHQQHQQQPQDDKNTLLHTVPQLSGQMTGSSIESHDEPSDRQDSGYMHSLDTETSADISSSSTSRKLSGTAVLDRGIESQVESQEEGIEEICSGLLNMLSGIVVMLPDSMVHRTLTKVLRVEVLIVLANTPSSRIRTAVIKLLDCYMKRAGSALKDAWMKKDRGFHLLGAQLHQYPATTEITEAVLSMLMGKTHTMSDSCDLDMLADLTNVQQGALVLLLSLFERSAIETSLCHNFLCTITRMCEQSLAVSSWLVEQGLIECVYNLLMAVNKTQPRATDLEGCDERQLLIGGIGQLLSLIAVREFSTSGPPHYQSFEDILILLRCLEGKQKNVYGEASREVMNIKTAQFHILGKVTDYLDTLCDERVAWSGWFKQGSIDSSISLSSLMLAPFTKPKMPSLAAARTVTSSCSEQNSILSLCSSDPLLHTSHHLPASTAAGVGSSNTGGNAPVVVSANSPTTSGSAIPAPTNPGTITTSATTTATRVTGTTTVRVSTNPIKKKLSSVLDFLLEGPDLLLLGNFPGSSEMPYRDMTPNYQYQSQDKIHRSYSAQDPGQQQPVHLWHASTPPFTQEAKTPASVVTTTGAAANQTTDLPLGRLGLLFKQKKKLPIPIGQSEMIDRLKKYLVLATDLLLFADVKKCVKDKQVRRLPLLLLHTDEDDSVSMEVMFQRQLLAFLYSAFTLTSDSSFFGRKKNIVLWSVKDVVKQQLSRLLVHMLSPDQSFQQKTYALSYITMEEHFRDLVQLVLTNQTQALKLSQCIYDLLTGWRDWLNSQEFADGCRLVNLLKQSGYVIPPVVNSGDSTVFKQFDMGKKSVKSEEIKQRDIWVKKRTVALSRVSHKFDSLAKLVSASAMEVTQTVTQLQNKERHKFVEHIKRNMTDHIQVKKVWQDLVQQLTHERAVWHCPESYPQSWQLDPTEGPCRVRRRLQRCHLGIASQFLTPENRSKLDIEKHEPPLLYLFEDDHHTSDSAALMYRLYTNEKIQHTCRCTAVTPASENKGDVLVGEHSVYFVADGAITDANYTQVLLGNKDELSMTWPHVDIKEIHRRWFQLRDIGLEIFLTNGKTYLLAFENSSHRDKLEEVLESLELPNLIQMENLSAIQQLWLDGRLTNYEYLTHLNKMAGRSFNDLMQYPIFPFVLSDYTSKALNLLDHAVYRNLSKPIAVQENSREERYVDTYNYLAGEYERQSSESGATHQVRAYHYGSHYSNSGTVLQFLVRLPPFTKMFISYQDNNFDLPDRTFHSMHTSWRLASFESTTDVKELIPEFFFLHEFLQNNEGYNFGRRQAGQIVDSVSLPPWCQQNARLFILVHRQALESAIVTSFLHQWIDLVFGYKQQGEAAIKAVNVFHPSTYFGMDVDSVTDPIRRQALRTMINTYGQTPKQLFRSAHPSQSGISYSTGSGWRSHRNKTPPASSSLSSSPLTSASILDSAQMSKVGVISDLSGLQWGNYIGSPDSPMPEAVWQQHYGNVVCTLVALPTGEVFGIAANSCLLVMYSKEKGVVAMNTTDVMWAAIVSWGHPDRILRIRNRQHKPSVNFLHEHVNDEVRCCASVSDCRLLFLGRSSGIITVYNTAYNSAKECDVQVFGNPRYLFGHSGMINTLQVCRAYSVLISASHDATCIIWDLNRLTYVRSIQSHDSAVKVLAISDTLGDIASVSNYGAGSCLQLHTINAVHVATQACDQTIHCLTFSSAAEGRSINVIAGGLASGVIRLWSSWDLMPVCDIKHASQLSKPVISLTYSPNGQRLYSSTADGTVTIWEHSNMQTKWTGPNFVPFL